MTKLALTGIRSTLIVAPHPDDETIGAYGLIRGLRLRGARVAVIVVSDGAASHPGSAGWPRDRLVRERRRETRLVLRRIGVAAGSIRFLGLPDGRLSRLDGAQRSKLHRAIAGHRNAALVVAPAGDDNHPDHRVVAAAASTAAPPGAQRIEYLVWSGRRRRAGAATLTLKLGIATAAKRAAIERYRTQTGGITDDPTGFAISRAELLGFARPLERYREARR